MIDHFELQVSLYCMIVLVVFLGEVKYLIHHELGYIQQSKRYLVDSQEIIRNNQLFAQQLTDIL